MIAKIVLNEDKKGFFDNPDEDLRSLLDSIIGVDGTFVLQVNDQLHEYQSEIIFFIEKVDNTYNINVE